ncbi:Hypothetical predicted protein [Mytilus galloprovincialis]|uniref:Uncharacterized protein n=1 Tax=Mytilus galloprovincialis TaxID=29158 RepID=A0A8B6D528_MYTGA|nr:Hypothetical predicted protein [Mytilus galloprovincialis]
MKSPLTPKSDIVTDTSDLASESSSEDECYFVPAMPTDSASTSTEETFQSDNDSDQLDDLVLTLIPPPRRSSRVRREPKWLRSGDFVVKSAVTCDWKAKAGFMASALKDRTLSGLEKETGCLFEIAYNKPIEPNSSVIYVQLDESTYTKPKR